jgi:hypothetical protein
MANTHKLIASSTIGSGGAADITFSSIPQTYTDLKLVMSMRSAGNLGGGNTYFDITTVSFNGSSSNFLQQQAYGNGSSTVAGTGATLQIHCPGNGATSNTFGNAEMYITNYTLSANKLTNISLVTENNATSAINMLIAGLWSQSAAINSINLTMYGGNIVQHSTFDLYGITKS